METELNQDTINIIEKNFYQRVIRGISGNQQIIEAIKTLNVDNLIKNPQLMFLNTLIKLKNIDPVEQATLCTILFGKENAVPAIFLIKSNYADKLTNPDLDLYIESELLTHLDDKLKEWLKFSKPSFWEKIFMKLFGKRFATGGVIKQAEGFDKFRKNIFELNNFSKK